MATLTPPTPSVIVVVIGDLGRMAALGTTPSVIVVADRELTGKDVATPAERASVPVAALVRAARCVCGGEDWYTARCTPTTWPLLVLLDISLSAPDHCVAARLGDSDVALRIGDDAIFLEELPVELPIALPSTVAACGFRTSSDRSPDVGVCNVAFATCEYDRL
jgi:hypothetical protein